MDIPWTEYQQENKGVHWNCVPETNLTVVHLLFITKVLIAVKNHNSDSLTRTQNDLIQ